MASKVDVSEDQWDGIDEETSQADEREDEYEDEEQLATVTVVEDFDPEELLHGQNTALRPQDDADVSKPLPSTQKMVEKNENFAMAQSVRFRTKMAKKAKGIKYQTNAARKLERAKQQKRKHEKAERAGGKATRTKAARGRR